MKPIILASVLLTLCATASADRYVTFSDGSTGWQNDSGDLRWKSPSPRLDDDDDQGSVARRTITDSDGTAYVPTGGGYINTQTGQFVPGN